MGQLLAKLKTERQLRPSEANHPTKLPYRPWRPVIRVVEAFQELLYPKRSTIDKAQEVRLFTRHHKCASTVRNQSSDEMERRSKL